MTNAGNLFSILIFYGFIPFFVIEIRINRPKDNICVKPLQPSDIQIIPKIVSLNSIFPFLFFTSFASLFAILFFGFKNIHCQIGQFRIPHLSCFLYVSPWTERGIVFIKCNIV